MVGCFLACFGKPKDRRNNRARRCTTASAPPSTLESRFAIPYGSLSSVNPQRDCSSSEPVVEESRSNHEYQLSSRPSPITNTAATAQEPRLKDFDTTVPTYDDVDKDERVSADDDDAAAEVVSPTEPTDDNDDFSSEEGSKTIEKHGRRSLLSPSSTTGGGMSSCCSSASSGPPVLVRNYPSNHRYHNCRDSDSDGNDESDVIKEEGDESRDDDDDAESCDDDEIYNEVEESGGGGSCVQTTSDDMSLGSGSSMELVEEEDEGEESWSKSTYHDLDGESPVAAEDRHSGRRRNSSSRHINPVLTPVENLLLTHQNKSVNVIKHLPRHHHHHHHHDQSSDPNHHQLMKENLIKSLEEDKKQRRGVVNSAGLKSIQDEDDDEEDDRGNQEPPAPAVDASLSSWLVSSSSSLSRSQKKTPPVNNNSSQDQAGRRAAAAAGRARLEPVQSEASSSHGFNSAAHRSSSSRDRSGTQWVERSPAGGDAGSASSFKGIPNTTSKYREDKSVNWHSTPFETRLQRALEHKAYYHPPGGHRHVIRNVVKH